MLEALTSLSVVHLTPGMNATGLSAIGFGPSHRLDSVSITTGVSSYKMIDVPRKLYLLQQVELEYEHYDPQLAMHALEKAETVVAITSFVTERMRHYADVLLPAAAWSEYTGTWVSACGDVHSGQAVKTLHQSSKSVWKIYRVLANLLKLKGFSYNDINALRHDIPLLTQGLTTEKKVKAYDKIRVPSRRNFTEVQKKEALYRVGSVGMYRSDTLVRRSQPLQASLPSNNVVRVHPDSIDKAKFTAGDIVSVTQGRNKLVCKLATDKTIAKGSVILPAAEDWSLGMAGRSAEIKIEASDKNGEAPCNN